MEDPIQATTRSTKSGDNGNTMAGKVKELYEDARVPDSGHMSSRITYGTPGPSQ